jgi:MFS family permease
MKRDLILVGVALTTWGIGEGMYFYFQPLYLEQLGASPVTIGSILGALGIAMTITLIPAGYLADRMGRRPLLRASWVIGLIATLIMALANSLSHFVIGLLLYGLTYFVMAPLNSYVTAARGKLSVGRAITLISATYSFGAIIGPLIGGFIGEAMGLRQIYFFSFFVFLISTIIIFLIRPQPVEFHSTQKSPLGLKINHRYLTYLVAIFIAVFATYLPQPLTPNFLQNERDLPISQIGQLGSIGSLGIVILSLVLGNLQPRIGFILSQITVGFFAALIWNGNNLSTYALAYLFVGGYRVTRSLAIAQTKLLFDQSKMGLTYAITETIGASAIILSPLLSGFLFEINPEIMYPFSIGLILISLIFSARFSPREKKVQIEQSAISSALD